MAGWVGWTIALAALMGVLWGWAGVVLALAVAAMLALVFSGRLNERSRATNGSDSAPMRNAPDFKNASGRIHASLPSQTWAAFLRETYRQRKNSGANVKLGSGFEIGIVGESFHFDELQWIRAQDFGPHKQRIRFTAYLIPEPENPHSLNGDAVRVESPRGGTIGHLSHAHAGAYASVFKALHAAKRVGVCRAVAIGGVGRKPNIGVWLNIGHAAWLAELITEAQQPRKPRKKHVSDEAAATDQPF